MSSSPGGGFRSPSTEPSKGASHRGIGHASAEPQNTYIAMFMAMYSAAAERSRDELRPPMPRGSQSGSGFFDRATEPRPFGPVGWWVRAARSGGVRRLRSKEAFRQEGLRVVFYRALLDAVLCEHLAPTAHHLLHLRDDPLGLLTR